MTSTKKKIVTSLVALMVVVAAAAVAFTAVWAARNATANTGFRIQYTAIHVSATISGTYQTNTMNSPTALTADPSGNSITFSGSEATDGTANVKQFTSVTPTLTESGDPATAYVDFVYTIVNNDSTNSMDIALASDPDTANNNLTYTYTVSAASATSTGNTYNNLVNGLPHGATATITIRATVDDLDQNVNAEGTFAFVLTGVAAA